MKTRVSPHEVRTSRRLLAHLLNELDFLDDDPAKARRVQAVVADYIERSIGEPMERPRAEGES